MNRKLLVLFVLSAVAGAVSTTASFGAPSPQPLHFNHDIRAILSNNCFLCHGPDSHNRKGKLRLDMPDDAFAQHDGGFPLVGGDPEKSQVIRRIFSTDPDEVMPPPKSGKSLTDAQRQLLKQWVSEGAKYEKLWSFIPPTRPPAPATTDAGWCSNEIDRFVLAKLEGEHLHPAPPADKITLCRRLYFDLLGLPPTPAEVDAFVNDASPDAWGKLVDRLLANPHFGERMALDWLDAARFADTNGYHIDTARDQTRWRDWVIRAYNQNKPFDQFTVEQLAGDLLPNATIDQRIATGFVRNNMINFEGGAIPQEYLTAYLMDRVNTTSMVWLGLTMQCCQCHDHKFDPLSQKNYYQLYAYFNAVPENGLDGRNGNAVPLLATPTPEQKQKLDSLAADIRRAEQKLTEPNPEADDAQLAWEQGQANRLVWTALHPATIKSVRGATLKLRDDGSILASGMNPSNDVYTLSATIDLPSITAIRLEALPEPKLRASGPGRSANGNFVLTRVSLSTGAAEDAAEPATSRKFKAAMADFSQLDHPVISAIAESAGPGWSIFPQVGKPHEAVFELEEPIVRTGAGPISVNITLAFESSFGQHQLGHFRVSATDNKAPRVGQGLPPEIDKALEATPEKRTAEQSTALTRYFRSNVYDATRKYAAEIDGLKREKEALEKKVPTTMVMAEMATPRPTHILLRGQYDKPGEAVTAQPPEQVAPLLPGAPANRLGLAQWLVARENPLVARVTVNRFWQSLFGLGLVKTAEDFGSQGEEPVNPELLDWMAVQFRDGDARTAPWDVKAMIRLIVTSSAYRQSSVATPELLARDPENRLLARGPRLRLQAEFIRDNALAVSGLLNDDIGGKSVSPYQPAGLWEELMSRADGANFTAQVYQQDHGKDLYRRTMYTFWKRTSPPPALSTFDAPDRETCTVRRARTNTPLQALVLMNDPTYVEAARKLAERMLTEAGASDDARITYAFRLATARPPTPAEIAILKRIHDRELAVFANDLDAANKLISVGESPRNESLDAKDLAAWTTTASVVLNLDETITKG